jgi:hypothetical protein
MDWVAVPLLDMQPASVATRAADRPGALALDQDQALIIQAARKMRFRGIS